MFKTASFENEIFRSMEKELIGSQVEQKFGLNKLTKAADYLTAAADIFEAVGMSKEADEVFEVLKEFSVKLSNKTSSL